MSKTWLENSTTAIRRLNELDRKVNSAKQRYMQSITAGMGDSIIHGWKQNLEKHIARREGFKEAFTIFSKGSI